MIILEITWKKRGCMGIPKLMVLLVIVLYLFLIISCFISNKEIFSSSWYFSAYKMVSSPYKWHNSFNHDANSSNYWETIQEANMYNRTLFLLCFSMGFFNDIDFAMVQLAWTTHAQGQPQLLHCSSFSFTFPNFIFS